MTSHSTPLPSRQALWLALACALLTPATATADPADSGQRSFLADGSFVAIGPNPPHGTSTVMTRTLVPPGTAVLQSTIPMAADPATPNGSQPATPASVAALDTFGATCQKGCGSPPTPPSAPIAYDITVPPGGPRVASARIRITFDATTRGRVSMRVSAPSVALNLRFEVAVGSIQSAWVSPRRDVLVLELGDLGNCCPDGATASWVSLDLQRLLGAGAGQPAADDSPASAAMGRVQSWRASLPTGWPVDVRQIDGFAVAQAAVPTAPMGSGAPSCADDEGTWTKTHRTLVATDQGQVEVSGVAIGSTADLDRDGRADLLVAYEHACQSGAGADAVQKPSGDFAVVLNTAGGLVLKQHAPIGSPTPEALWNVAIQRQGRSVVIRAAGMKSGARPAPIGEMYDFKVQAGQLVLARRFPGSG